MQGTGPPTTVVAGIMSCVRLVDFNVFEIFRAFKPPQLPNPSEFMEKNFMGLHF
jgi:hypothetical protein